ncbi:MAG TPA: LPS export ABC transporter permease LptG [Burkholderiaceae bacterium]
MRVLQRYFFTEIMQAVLLVLAAFLAIFSFFELTEELGSVGKNGYQLQHAFIYIAMGVPGRIYELMPMAALIGSIYALAQLANRSEFTIMRAASLSTRDAGLMLFKIGSVFVLTAFIFGELVAPWSTQAAERLKLGVKGAAVSQEFRSGMWTKDNIKAKGLTGPVVGARFFNIRDIAPDGQLQDVKLYEFDTNYRLLAMVLAKRGSYRGDNTWRLTDVTETVFLNALDPRAIAQAGPAAAPAVGLTAPPGAPFAVPGNALVVTKSAASKDIVSEITPKILSVSAANPKRMSAYELSVYTKHLADNKQDSERYQIAFWKKIVDPFAVFVMMALALPFAYLHVRSGGVSLKIFVGIMIGVSFVLLNSLFSHLGLLNTWPPFTTAVAPSALFMLLAIGALRWVERH